MLAALLLTGMLAAPLTTATLFLRVRRPREVAGPWPALRRLLSALAGTAVVAWAAGGVLLLLGDSMTVARMAADVLVLASLVWLPVTRRWTARAHLAWSSTVFLFVIYLVFILDWTFAGHLGAVSTAGGLLLWLLEVAAAIMACAYLWELCDALGTQRWRRRITPAMRPTPGPAEPLPFVSLHMPAHNEPPDMVIQTLASLTRIDYPAFEIVAIDDNTTDEALWHPVENWCTRNGVKFRHLQDWPGYKSGALNYALRQMTDPRAEIIGVVDSDYQLAPEFLHRCVPLFAQPRVGFIQAPQDYRDWRQAAYYRRLYYSYAYFFAVSQPSRNERNGAIFAGTMGLIRRSALEEVGGWDQWCITEDAELSLRLLRGGWTGLHVDESWGRGIMPLTFEALKSQRYRWCFGGIQILRMHWRSLVPGRRTPQNQMTAAQRWSYLAGALQWYGDLLGLAFYLVLLAGAANLADGGGELFRKLTPFLVAIVPVLVALGLARAVALLRSGTGASWREAVGAFFIWQSTALAVARSSVLALFARKAVFLRTPKTNETEGWWQALRGNWVETLLALLGLLGIAGALTRHGTASGPLLAGLLAVPTLGLAAAPVNSIAARRAALPADLRQRRRTEALRDRRAVAATATAAAGVAVTATAFAVLLALLLAPGPLVTPPRLTGPGAGGGSVARPSHSASPTSSGSLTSPGTPRPALASPSPGMMGTPAPWRPPRTMRAP
jgi:hypothetical protein